MDEKVKKAFETAELMAVLASQKNILREEFKQSLVHYQNGGSFTLTKDFLNFVKLLLDSNQLEDVVLIDDNDIPVVVSDLKAFFEKILSQYTESVNEYYTKYNLLIKTRKVESIIDIL